jgi:hypothetical protein
MNDSELVLTFYQEWFHDELPEQAGNWLECGVWMFSSSPCCRTVLCFLVEEEIELRIGNEW